MPYNPGTGVYTLPAVYLAVPGTTILATQHNTPLEDLEVANNYARPIIAGGTGQATAALARGSTGLSTAGNIGLKGANIASAATLALVADFNYFHVTGAVAITAISARAIGERILLEFEASPILTYHVTNLILIGNANLKVAAGTVMEFVYEGASSWRQVAMVSRPPTQTLITVSGTVWTRPPGCLYADFEACGAGAGAGGVDGQGAGTSAATGGGGGGFSGSTGLIDVTATVSAVVTIGAGGAGGVASANGISGGNTAITIGATTYTWGGGNASSGRLGSGGVGTMAGGAGGTGTNVRGSSIPGGNGVSSGADTNATSGSGGSSMFGEPGVGARINTATAITGQTAGGFGAGGAGGVTAGVATDANGGAGSAGYMRITEYYG